MRSKVPWPSSQVEINHRLPELKDIRRLYRRKKWNPARGQDFYGQATLESVYMGLRFKVKRIGRVNLVHKMNHNPIQGMQEATLSSTFGQEKNNEVTRQRWLKGKFKSFSITFMKLKLSQFFSFIDISLLSFNQIICSNYYSHWWERECMQTRSINKTENHNIKKERKTVSIKSSTKLGESLGWK